MRDTLSYRGPDGFGSTFFQSGKIALGHRRLSIIDLSDKGRQPISNEDGTIWVTCNGEIYNYKELRKTLEASGHLFASQSDTEVLVHGYEEWGIQMLNRLKGMFAFGIWDDKKRELLVARDRFGIKPLYYYASDDRFLFASEIKAIIADPIIPRVLNEQAVCDFFKYRFIPSPSSIWKGIYKLPPAHYLHLKEGEAIKIEKYWSLKTNNATPPLREVAEKLDELLEQSIEEHLSSDVPVGLLLSGGFDSSTIAYYLSRKGRSTDSFTIGFEDWKLSEHESARLAAKTFKTNHQEQFVGRSLLKQVKDLSYYFDEPLGGTSFLPSFELAKFAAQSTKVVLGGDGGDEALAGYKWYNSYGASWYQSPRKTLRNYISGQNTLLGHYQEAMNWADFTSTDLSALLGPALKGDGYNSESVNELYPLVNQPVKTLQLLDYHYFLPEVVLHKIDRASMAHGLEVRVPFLDHELVAYMMSLSEQVYFSKEQQKQALFEVMKDRLPKELLRKPKKGFGMSVNHFFDLKYFPKNWRASNVIIDRLLNPKEIQNLLTQKSLKKLWAILIFMNWYDQWKK